MTTAELGTTAELAERVRRIEARLAIGDLAVRYCVAIDDGDYAGIAGMFTDKTRLGQTVGREAVVGLLRSIRSGYGRTVHTPEAHTVRLLADDRATGIVLSHAELDIGGTTVHSAIRYYDEYERGEDGAWRFASRTLKFAYAVPVGELADSLTAPDPVRWPGTAPAPADPF